MLLTRYYMFPTGIILLIFLITHSDGFYLPWSGPSDYNPGDKLELKAVKLTSVKSALPYDYFSLKFCNPQEGIVYNRANIGQILRGDREVNTDYKISMLDEVLCRVAANADDVNKFIFRIQQDYMVQLLLDNLPTLTIFSSVENLYDIGYKLGTIKDDTVYINNHINFILKYHKTHGGTYRLVGFTTTPESYVDTAYNEKTSCDLSPKSDENAELPLQGQILKPDHPADIIFSYSVKWIASEVRWASRWESILQPRHKQIHWFAILNSLAIILFLSGIVAIILIRLLRRDIAKYNRDVEDILEESIDEAGWKLIHGDVFRPPPNIDILTTLYGTGVQLYCLALMILFLACLGMLTPSSRGALLTSTIVLFTLMGSIGGFLAGKLYKTLSGRRWKLIGFQTAVFYPGIVFIVAMVVNVVVWSKASSQAIPFSTIALLLFLWVCISLPLVMLGFYFGFSSSKYYHPVRTNCIPRHIPEQVWYMSPYFSSFMGGLLPFGAVFLELYFVFAAIWEQHFYYLFGFLFLVFIIYTIATIEVSILYAYFQVCGEDYKWWWRSSYHISLGFVFHVFVYTFLYFQTKLEINDFVSFIIYWVYSAMMLFTLWLISGSISLTSAYFLIRKIYAAVKID